MGKTKKSKTLKGKTQSKHCDNQSGMQKSARKRKIPESTSEKPLPTQKSHRQDKHSEQNVALLFIK